MQKKPTSKTSITDGSDYRGSTQTFVVNSGERRCITVEILDDSLVESQESLWVYLTVESFSVHDGLIIYITDNDGKCITSLYNVNLDPNLQVLSFPCLPFLLLLASMRQPEVYIFSKDPASELCVTQAEVRYTVLRTVFFPVSESYWPTLV